jgi:protease-4
LAIAAPFIAAAAFAQQPFDRPTRLPAFGRSLAFLPHAELRWSSLYLGEKAFVPWQGHAVAFGFPIPFLSLSTGVRLDLLNPTDRFQAVSPVPAGNYQWLTWGLALKTSDSSAIGVSLQRSYSEYALAQGLSSWSIGLSTRPFDGVGLSVVASDVNSPHNEFGGGLDRSYDVALALRPFGTRVAELGLEAKYVDGRFECDGARTALESCSYWVPRATLGLDIPPLGRLRADVAVSDPADDDRRAWLASGALAFYMNSPSGSVELAGGSVVGNGLGRAARYRAHENLQTEIAMRGFRETSGSESPRFAARVRIEDTPSTRKHVSLLRKLWRLADEPKLEAVVFEVRTTPGDTLARVQEMRDAVELLRQKGKRVLCHLEDADGSSLYFCSAADRILINPAGGIRFAGLRTQHLFFSELLQKLGIRAEFVRIGDYKSAPEQFTRTTSTDAARAARLDLLAQHERQFVEALSRSRRIPPDEVRRRIARGPFIASEAYAAGLVDGYAYDDELERAASELVGGDVQLIEDSLAPRAPERFGNVPRVAVVYVEGDMVDGRSNTIPLLGTKLAGSYTLADTLKQVREDPFTAAVVLRVETPGGSAMAADVIWREVQLTAHVKPVIVSMGTYAASGGYYISAPATRVFANPLTITGSIGIFYGKADVAELLKKIGVNVETYKTAPRADAESIFRPFSDDERQELRRKVGQFYDVFLSRVSLGRRLSKAQVDAVGRGRVWTGEQAVSRRLVDELGGLRQALEYARKLAVLPEHAPIIELPPPDTSLIGRLLGIEGLHQKGAGDLLPAQLMEVAQALAPFTVYSGDKPMARLELTPVVQ